MRNYTILMNGLPISQETPAELTDSFSVDFPSPNPQKTAVENLKVWDTNDEYNGFRIFYQAVQQNGWHNPIPVQIIDNTTSETIFNGFTLPFSPAVKQDIRKKSLVLPLIEYGQNFEDVLQRVHLRRFAAATESFTTWSSAVNYTKGSVVNFQNNLYKANNNNTNVSPTSVIGSNVWQLIGSTPVPNAFTNADYEVIYCVEEEPDSQTDAAYWLTFLLSLVTLFLLLVDITQEIIRLGSIDPANFAAAVVGLALKSVVLLVYVYQLIAGFVIPIRKYYAIKVRKLLEKAFNFLGYGFKSSILQSSIYDNLVILPRTNAEAVISGNPKNNPLPDSTLGELCANLASMFKGRFKPMTDINNGQRTIYFETEDFYWSLQSPTSGQQNNFIIPSMQNEGEIVPTNFDELYANYTLRFSKDATDRKNRKQNYREGLTAVFEIKNSLDLEKRALTRTEEINLPYAQAMRKGGDSTFQQLFNGIYDALSFLVGNVDRGGNRRGCVMIPSGNVLEDKIFITDGKNLVSDKDEKYINAGYLYENYHRKSINKQWIRVLAKAPFTQQPRFAKQLYYWNTCLDEQGNTCVVTNFERDINKGTINIEYRYQEQYQDSNLITERFTID